MSYHGIGATRTPLATRSTGLDLTTRGTAQPITSLVTATAPVASSRGKWLLGGSLVSAFILVAFAYKKGWFRR